MDSGIEKYFKFFYNKNAEQGCPQCQTPGIVKSYDAVDNAIVMKCENPKCQWNVKIIKPQFVDLYNILYDKRHENAKLLYQLSLGENEAELKELKAKYLQNETEINGILAILNKQQAETEKLSDERFKIFSEYIHLYYERKEVFKKIDVRLDAKQRDILFNIYQTEYAGKEKLTELRYGQIAKQLKISTENVKNILLWMDIGANYIKLQKVLTENIGEIRVYEREIDGVNSNYLIAPAKIITEKAKEIPKKIIKKIQETKQEAKQREKDNIKTIVIPSSTMEKKSPSPISKSKKIQIKREREKPMDTIGEKKVKIIVKKMT